MLRILTSFDTVDHQILLTKLNQYGICRVLHDWFKSYLSNRNQYISMNGYDSGVAAINYGVSQGSAIGLLLFLLYINDLNQTIKSCKAHLIVLTSIKLSFDNAPATI